MNNASSLTFTTSAVIVSYILIEQLTTNQQNIIGGWFNIIGEILSASASWNDIMDLQNQNDEDNMETLKKSIEKIEELLNQQDQDKKCKSY